MPFLWGPAECKPKAVASHYLYNPSSWPCSEMWLLQFAANASPCSYDLIPDKGGGGRERQGLLTFASGQHSSISQTLMIFLLLFNYLPQLMKFMSSSSKAVAEGVWGVGWLGASPPTSSTWGNIICCHCHTWGVSEASCIVKAKNHFLSTFCFIAF